MKIPDYMAPLTGWRVWNVAGPQLIARHVSNDGCVWPARKPMRAECRGRTDAPHRSASECHVHYLDGAMPPGTGITPCGIYSYKTPEMAWREEVSPDIMGVGPMLGTIVFGSVALWGRVFEHKDGYRAEYAYPLRLFSTDMETANRVSSMYHVKVSVILSWDHSRLVEQALGLKEGSLTPSLPMEPAGIKWYGSWPNPRGVPLPAPTPPPVYSPILSPADFKALFNMFDLPDWLKDPSEKKKKK